MNRFQRYREKRVAMRRVRQTLRRIESYTYPPKTTVRITVPIWVWLPYVVLWGLVVYLLAR